jgi:hypothetical protein
MSAQKPQALGALKRTGTANMGGATAIVVDDMPIGLVDGKNGGLGKEAEEEVEEEEEGENVVEEEAGVRVATVFVKFDKAIAR